MTVENTVANLERVKELSEELDLETIHEQAARAAGYLDEINEDGNDLDEMLQKTAQVLSNLRQIAELLENQDVAAVVAALEKK